MKKKKVLDLNVNMDEIRCHQDYQKTWGQLGRLEIKMVEKHEQCKHKLGDKFIFTTPYKKPGQVCNALLHVLDLYTWRAALGFPSWNVKNRRVFRLHCPDPKGTVWEMRRLDD